VPRQRRHNGVSLKKKKLERRRIMEDLQSLTGEKRNMAHCLRK